MGTRTDPHGSGGLLRPDADSGGDPNVCRGNGGSKFHNPIADEHHPDAATSRHARIHRGDCHTNTRLFAGSVYANTKPGAGDRCTDSNDNADDLSCDSRRPIPTDIAEYSRSHWKHWTDEDGDCQDARQEALVSESLVEVTFESERKCRVATGRWYGAFTGIYVEAPGDLDIDHLVPLKNAHDSGGWAWSSDRKQEYANYLRDPDHLIAVTKGANRSKGAKGPEEWRPPDEGYWCQYATDWTEVKLEWRLTMTQREAEAVIEMLDTCREPVEVKAERAEGTAAPDTSERAATGEATPTLVPDVEPEANTSVYGSCEEAVQGGESRVQGSVGGGKGFPQEVVPSARDGDGDGVVCER